MKARNNKNYNANDIELRVLEEILNYYIISNRDFYAKHNCIKIEKSII